MKGSLWVYQTTQNPSVCPAQIYAQGSVGYISAVEPWKDQYLCYLNVSIMCKFNDAALLLNLRGSNRACSKFQFVIYFCMIGYFTWFQNEINYCNPLCLFTVHKESMAAPGGLEIGWSGSCKHHRTLPKQSKKTRKIVFPSQRWTLARPWIYPTCFFEH